MDINTILPRRILVNGFDKACSIFGAEAPTTPIFITAAEAQRMIAGTQLAISVAGRTIVVSVRDDE